MVRTNLSWIPHLAASLVAAVMFIAIYDPFHAGAISFLALAPIALVFTNPDMPCSLPRAGACGFLFGLTAAMAIVGPWMYGAAVDYFQQTGLWSLGFTLLLNSAYVASFYAAAFVALRLVALAPPTLRVLGAASIWILFETLRAAPPIGNTWAPLGLGVAQLPVLREAASYGGLPFLGWLAAVSGAAIGVSLQPSIGLRDAMTCGQLGIAAPVLAVLLGTVASYGDEQRAPLQPLRVAVVQAQIAGDDVWDPAQRLNHWNAYLHETVSLQDANVDLILWPENAVPFLLNADADAQTRLLELATTLDASILLGAPRSQSNADGTASIYNSAYFFAPQSAQPLTYDKQRLLPFVETMPVRANEWADGAPYTAGVFPTTFNVNGWKIQPLLCFEAAYPEYARTAVLNGAHLLANLSNDAWFAAGAGPEQHYALSMARAVELRRPMVRAANGGISGAVTADGEAIGFPIERRQATVVYEIPSPPRTMTLAARRPNVILWVCGLWTLLAYLAAARSRTWR